MAKKKQRIDQIPTQPQQPTQPPGVLGMLTGKVAKIGGTFVLLTGLLTQFDSIVTGAKKVSDLKIWGTGASASPAECFTGELRIQPVAVPVVGWPKVKFRLTGRNACAQKLEVHVAYKAPAGLLRLESPFSKPEQSSCNVYDVADCWEARSIDGNASIDWLLTPPSLRRVGQLADPVKVSINWVVYNTETRKQIRAGTTEVTVRDED